MTKAKGQGSGSCCCGGCKRPPMAYRTTVGGITSVPAVQQYCCSCLPKYACITLSGSGTLESQYDVVERYCPTASDSGDPIQFQTSVVIDSGSHTLNVRLKVSGVNNDCYIAWDIPDLNLSDSVLIDQNDPPTSGVCTYGQMQKKCVEFGGEWDIPSKGLSLAISEPPVMDLKDYISCGGCNCICECMCFSIWKITANSGLTMTGQSDIVCASGSRILEYDCGTSGFFTSSPTVSWSSSGWSVQLGEASEHRIVDYSVPSGTEGPSGVCSVRSLIWNSDEYSHVVSGVLGVSGVAPQVEYEWDVNNRIAKTFKWVGQSQPEASYTVFDAWDWASGVWRQLTSVEGRPSGCLIDRVKSYDLDSVYTGTAGDEGSVRLRLTALSGNYLATDMLRVTTSDCCEMVLTAPVTFVTPPERIQISPQPTGLYIGQENTCPDPAPRWTNLVDTSGDVWSVALECNWCGGLCGSVISQCCNRPLPRTVFAEVLTGCSACSVPTTVPLVASAFSALWDGSTSGTQPQTSGTCWDAFDITLGCAGSGLFSMSMSSSSCSTGPMIGSGTCDPLNITFTGTLTAGINCCGLQWPYVSSIGVSVTVVE